MLHSVDHRMIHAWLSPTLDSNKAVRHRVSTWMQVHFLLPDFPPVDTEFNLAQIDSVKQGMFIDLPVNRFTDKCMAIYR